MRTGRRTSSLYFDRFRGRAFASLIALTEFGAERYRESAGVKSDSLFVLPDPTGAKSTKIIDKI